MKIYTLFDRWHLDTDMADEYHIYALKTFIEAKQKAEDILADFKRCTGVEGNTTHYENEQQTYASYNYYDEDSDQYDTIEIEQKEF